MVFVFSLLLIGGIVSGQIFDLAQFHNIIFFSTSLCLAYIMIEVGLEFAVDKKSLASYGWDSLIASGAALIPAVLWFGYFIFVVQSEWKHALLAGLSSAPTSAGVLFSMLSAAGLSATWVFQKARILAVLDDLVTVLLLTPLVIIIEGFEWSSILTLACVSFFIFASFRWQNTLHLPVTKVWLLIYAFLLTTILAVEYRLTHIHLEVLIPAFMVGCLLHLSKDRHEENEAKGPSVSLDTVIKGLFMLLVGLSLPKILLGEASWATTAMHVVLLTIFANLGKLFLVFCYSKEATLKERMALGVAMFPRGEVGAAVLLIGVGFGLGGYANTLAVLSLGLNLVLTGGFIWMVIKLLKTDTKENQS